MIFFLLTNLATYPNNLSILLLELPFYLLTYLPTQLPTYLPTYAPTFLPTTMLTYLPMFFT
jgi:hypothetical protein